MVLPTGAGKTWVACLAIDDRRRSTLVVAPTLDLVRQWYDVLRTTFGVPVGVIGGGEYDVRSLTVSTYDSAHLHMEHSATGSGWSCSTSVTTCRGPPTPSRRARASRRSASA